MKIRALVTTAAVLGSLSGLRAQEGSSYFGDDGPSSQFVSLAAADPADCSTCGNGTDACGRLHGDCCGCDGNQGRLRVEGWLDAGFMLNADSPSSGFNGPYNQIDRDEGAFNQGYLIIERQLDPGPQWSIGGRVDVLYGSDFFLAQSIGMEKNPDGSSRWNGDYYGLAFPQAYGEIGNDRLSLKIGHFYTIVGYEGVPAVNNFFYSKSLSYMFAGPFVQWGGLATWKATDGMTIEAGLVNGWDALDRVGDRASLLARVALGSDEDPVWTSFSIITGDERNHLSAASTDRTRLSLIVGANLTCRLQYVIQPWYGYQNSFFATGQSAEWYGIDQYLYYDLTSTLRLGGRIEWFRDDDGARLGLSRPPNPNKGPYVGSMYSLSLGVNWTPRTNLILRPEVRWDWFDGAGLPFDDGNADDQFLVGMDAIWRF